MRGARGLSSCATSAPQTLQSSQRAFRKESRTLMKVSSDPLNFTLVLSSRLLHVPPGGPLGARHRLQQNKGVARSEYFLAVLLD